MHAQEPAAPAQAQVEDVEMEVDMEEEEEPIRVVKNYVRPAPTGMRMLHGQPYDPTKFAVSPITGARARGGRGCRVWCACPRWLCCFCASEKHASVVDRCESGKRVVACSRCRVHASVCTVNKINRKHEGHHAERPPDCDPSCNAMLQCRVKQG